MFDNIENFPISELIKLPSIVELMKIEWLQDVDAEQIYKYGSSINKELLSKTTITHSKKFVTASVGLYHLNENYTTFSNDEWTFNDNNDIIHLMVGEGFDLGYHSEIELLLNNKIEIDMGKIYTFPSHMRYREVLCKKNRFKFIWKVVESDYIEPKLFFDAIKTKTEVYENKNKFTSIEKSKNEVYIRTLKPNIVTFN